MVETTRIICGGQSDHEHNDDWVYIETFEGSMYRGPEDGVRKEISDKGEREQTWSVCCSVCGSSAFGRDVYYGLE